MEKENEKFVTRTSLTKIFETKEYFESVEDDLTLNLDEPFFEIDNGCLFRHIRPVNVDEIIKLLSEIKEDGCNFAQIRYHEDHLCYEIIGLEIRTSTEDEINEWIKYQDLYVKKEKQISDLEKQIREIKKSI